MPGLTPRETPCCDREPSLELAAADIVKLAGRMLKPDIVVSVGDVQVFTALGKRKNGFRNVGILAEKVGETLPDLARRTP